MELALDAPRLFQPPAESAFDFLVLLREQESPVDPAALANRSFGSGSLDKLTAALNS